MEKEKNVKISSVKELLDIVEELSESYTSNGFSNSPIDKKFIFRGHSDTEFKLLPAILEKRIL